MTLFPKRLTSQTLGTALVVTALALPLTSAAPSEPPGVTVAGVSRPAAGEIVLEGVVQSAAAVGAASPRQFMLAVAQVTTPGDRHQTLSPAHPKTVLVGEGAPIFRAEGDAASPASADELRVGAKVRCLGANSGVGKPMVARLIVVLSTADTAIPGANGAADAASQIKVGENLLTAATTKDAYTLFQNSPEVHATLATADDGALKVSVDKVGKDEWSLMLGEAKPLTLIDGVSYRLSFSARADKSRTYKVISLINQPDYHDTGLFQPFTATTDWQTFSFVFAPHDTVSGHSVCPQFLLGKETGDLYLRDITLTAAPNTPIVVGNLLQPLANPDSFRLLVYGGAQATLARESGALRVAVSKKSDAWNVQVTPGQAALKEGEWYTLRFRAWSPVARVLTVSSGTSTPPYHTVGLDRKITIGPEQKQYTLTFQANGTIPADRGVNIAPIFPVGDAPGTLYLSEITLAPGRSPETGTGK